MIFRMIFVQQVDTVIVMNWMIVIVVMIFLRVYGICNKICSTGEDNGGDEVDENDIQCSSALLSTSRILFLSEDED